MPFRNREIFQLGLLFLCVPVQYLFSSYLSSTTGRTQALFDIINDFKEVTDLLFSAGAWKQRWDGLVSSLVQVYFPELSSYTRSYVYNEHNTSPAVEVMRYDRNAGYFGMGTEIRYERPSHLRYRIGQVVRHQKRGYRAVIVGWDLIAKAPQSWLKKIYGESMVTRDWPHYALLIDNRDVTLLYEEDYIRFSNVPTTYVVQEDLELLKSTEIQNADVDGKFEYFDGAQYIPGPNLKAIYPKD
ncbi:uncharacterized protein LOC124721911 [Schistocerca piceifrons]|uniref:uncharacterized protein LOC124721911 n=1 Tax=Schistocerca piceifrons TaxID=274613 RepID=UPI001F5E4330|nr:uncharacterized protein LOC124721911 [Schistocerca piceifrons]XP_047103022.1 uncharacterized protein LOC124721911 [Schistocerca piceifrons]